MNVLNSVMNPLKEVDNDLDLQKIELRHARLTENKMKYESLIMYPNFSTDELSFKSLKKVK